MKSTSSTEPIIPQSRVQPPVLIDDKQWFYKDPQNTVQGPFSSADMERWFAAGYFTIFLPVKRMGETQFSSIEQLTKELGRLPFRTDVPSSPLPPQQPIVSEPQKFNPMTYAATSTANNTFVDDYLMQQQSRQNVPPSMLFNRYSPITLEEVIPMKIFISDKLQYLHHQLIENRLHLPRPAIPNCKPFSLLSRLTHQHRRCFHPI